MSEKWVSCVLVGGSFHWDKLQDLVGGTGWWTRLATLGAHPMATNRDSPPVEE